MKTDHLKYLILTISILLTVGINLYAENTSDTEPFNTISKIKSRGVLRIGLSHLIPWTMKDKKGNLSGYEIDMASKMAMTSE